MTMVAPETIIEECKNKSYKELLAIRDKYLKEIRYYEKNKDKLLEEIIVHPSPDVIYQWNLNFLGKLFSLIEEKFNEESIELEEEVIKFAQSNGYDSVIITGYWKDYVVYEPMFFDEENHYTGLPHYILANKDEIRLTNDEECFEILGYYENKDSK